MFQNREQLGMGLFGAKNLIRGRAMVESAVLINLSRYIVVISPRWGLAEIFLIAPVTIPMTGLNER